MRSAGVAPECLESITRRRQLQYQGVEDSQPQIANVSCCLCKQTFELFLIEFYRIYRIYRICGRLFLLVLKMKMTKNSLLQIL